MLLQFNFKNFISHDTQQLSNDMLRRDDKYLYIQFEDNK